MLFPRLSTNVIFLSPWVLLPEWLRLAWPMACWHRLNRSVSHSTGHHARCFCQQCPHTGLKHSSKIALHLYLGLMHTMKHKYSYSLCLSMIAALLANKEQCLLDIQANIQLLTHTCLHKRRASCWRQAGSAAALATPQEEPRPLLQEMSCRHEDLCDAPLQKWFHL